MTDHKLGVGGVGAGQDLLAAHPQLDQLVELVRQQFGAYCPEQGPRIVGFAVTHRS